MDGCEIVSSADVLCDVNLLNRSWQQTQGYDCSTGTETDEWMLHNYWCNAAFRCLTEFLYLFVFCYESVKYYALFSFFAITVCTCFPISSHQTVNVFNKILFLFICIYFFGCGCESAAICILWLCLGDRKTATTSGACCYLFVTGVDKMMMFLSP